MVHKLHDIERALRLSEKLRSAPVHHMGSTPRDHELHMHTAIMARRRSLSGKRIHIMIAYFQHGRIVEKTIHPVENMLFKSRSLVRVITRHTSDGYEYVEAVEIDNGVWCSNVV